LASVLSHLPRARRRVGVGVDRIHCTGAHAPQRAAGRQDL